MVVLVAVNTVIYSQQRSNKIVPTHAGFECWR